MQTSTIQSIDSYIVLGYFAIIILMGIILSRRTKTGSDFFLAGNRLGWAAIGFSLFASNISSSTLIGLTGQAYLTGISIANYEWMATLLLIFIGIFVVPFYLRNKIRTVPEYLELRFSAFCRKYYSGVTVLLTIVVDIASSLFAGAIVLHLFYPQIGVTQGCYIIALVAGLYTAGGGLAAVVYTDILQAAILLLGTSILLFAILGQFDFSWTEAMASIPKDHASFIQPLDDSTVPWLGTLIGLPVIGFYYWGTNQYIVQRILGAKNERAAKWGTLLGAFLKLSMLFLIVFPGAFAFSVFPDISDPDMLFPHMITELIPPGVLGLVLAGLLAAIMSSVDSALSASAALIVLDFVQPSKPGMNERDLARHGRIVTLILMVFAGLWAPNIQHFAGLFNYLQLVLSYAVPPIVVVFLGGFFISNTSGHAAKWTLLSGHLISMIVLVLDIQNVIDVHFTILAGILALVSTAIMLVLSKYYEVERDLTNLTYKFLTKEKLFSNRWFEDYRLYSMLLAILTLVLLILYW